MNRIRPCWAPIGTRPEVAAQLIREYIYLYGAVSPKDGTCVYLIMPTSNTECFQVFLNAASLARQRAQSERSPTAKQILQEIERSYDCLVEMEKWIVDQAAKALQPP